MTFIINKKISILFIENNETKEEVYILGDPYYKLDEFIDGKWKKIDEHRCGH